MVLYWDNPIEKVLGKDNYVRLDKIIQFENYDDLVKFRRQKDCLSIDKLNELLKDIKNIMKIIKYLKIDRYS